MWPPTVSSMVSVSIGLVWVSGWTVAHRFLFKWQRRSCIRIMSFLNNHMWVVCQTFAYGKQLNGTCTPWTFYRSITGLTQRQAQTTIHTHIHFYLWGDSEWPDGGTTFKGQEVRLIGFLCRMTQRVSIYVCANLITLYLQMSNQAWGFGAPYRSMPCMRLYVCACPQPFSTESTPIPISWETNLYSYCQAFRALLSILHTPTPTATMFTTIT